MPRQGRGAAVPVLAVTQAHDGITRAYRDEWARVVAALTRRFGDLSVAEEATADAFAAAVERWPVDGIPPNPGAWLTTTAHRKAIDWIRRENKRDDKQGQAQMLEDDEPPDPAGPIEDDRLRLIFTCCHPALAMDTRVALTLRLVGGLTTARDRARAFLLQESDRWASGSPGRRAKIMAARIPVPGAVRWRICRDASQACSPSCSSSSTRATSPPTPTPTAPRSGHELTSRGDPADPTDPCRCCRRRVRSPGCWR